MFFQLNPESERFISLFRKSGQPEQMCLNAEHPCFTFSTRMKRLFFQHRMLSTSALAAFFLAGSLHAQEPSSASPQAPQPEENIISTPRRVAGLGVLAFLIGWIIWRNGATHKRPDKQEEENSRDSETRE